MSEFKPKTYTYFIGIDVSRNHLDYVVMEGKKFLFHKELTNEPISILEFINELKTLPKFTIGKSVFVMEQTGYYCNHLVTVLKRVKANFAIENAMQIKNSMGVLRGKDDKLDAIRIAQYAYNNRELLTLKELKRPVMIQLSNIYNLRNRLLGMHLALKAPIKEQELFVKKLIYKDTIRSCNRSLEAIKTDIQDIDIFLNQLISSDENLKKLFKIVTSVPYIGTITAIQIIISTNEFKDIHDPKKFACYAGVAPFKNESGMMKGRARVSPIANKKVKALLHICALGALQHDPELKEYFNRKVNEGKPKMAVINALKYKLILRVFACVNQGRCYSKEYSRKNQLRELEYDMSIS